MFCRLQRRAARPTQTAEISRRPSRENPPGDTSASVWDGEGVRIVLGLELGLGDG